MRGGCCLFLAEARRAPYGPANRGKAAACRFLRRFSPPLLAAFPVFERPLFACQTARAGPFIQKTGCRSFRRRPCKSRGGFGAPYPRAFPESKTRPPAKPAATAPRHRLSPLRARAAPTVRKPHEGCPPPARLLRQTGWLLRHRAPFQATRTRGMEAFGAVTPCRWMGRTSRPCVFLFAAFFSWFSALPAALCKKRDALFAIPPVTSPFANGRAAGAPEPFFAARSLPAGQRPFRDRARGIARPLSRHPPRRHAKANNAKRHALPVGISAPILRAAKHSPRHSE